MRKFILGVVCGVLGVITLAVFKGSAIAEFIDEKTS